MFSDIFSFLIKSISGVFTALLMVRFYMQWKRISFRNQIGEFLFVTTNWIVLPLRKVIPSISGVDLSSLLAAWLVQVVTLMLLVIVGGGVATLISGLPGLMSLAVIELVRASLYLVIFITLLSAVLSWVSPHAPIAPLINQIVAPFLVPIRRIMPPIANIDLSPLVLLILIQVLLMLLDHLSAAVYSFF